MEKIKAEDIPSECIQEPRFIKVLAASLCSEIAETKVALDETNGKIQESKGSLLEGWQKRKKLKQSIEEMSQEKQVLNAALKSLVRETKNRSIDIEIVKNCLDDATLCSIGKRVGFENIMEDYRNTWIRYKDEYEKQPLAVERERCRVDVKRATVQHMMTEYKMKQYNIMIKQGENHLSLQIKAAMIDFSKTMLQRWEDDKYLENLESIGAQLEEKLNGYTLQLAAEVQREIDNKRLAEYQDAAKMPPPRLHFPSLCSIIYPNAHRPNAADEKQQEALKIMPSRQQRSSNLLLLPDDIETTSVNTLMLEEMCTDEVDDYDSSVDYLDRGLVTTAAASGNSNVRSTDDSRCLSEKIDNLEIGRENSLLECYEKECGKEANRLNKNEEAGWNVERSIERFDGNTKILSTTVRSELYRIGFVPEKDESPMPPMMVQEDKSENGKAEFPTDGAGQAGSSSIGRKRYESGSESMCDHEIDDSTLFRQTRKMRKMGDKADYSSGFLLKGGQEGGAPKCDNAPTPGQDYSSPLSRSYLPSCVSSDNLSNMPDWPKISRAGADFASFRNWDNWSPTGELSVISFSPSSFVGTSKNNDSPAGKERKISGQQNSIGKEKPDDNAQTDTFFKTMTQKSKGSFL